MRHKHFTIKAQLISDYQVVDGFFTIEQLRKNSDKVLDVEGIYADSNQIFRATLTDMKINIISLTGGIIISSMSL